MSWRKNGTTAKVEERTTRMIELNHVSKTYAGKERKAVDDLTWTVEDGKITGFFGPNGAGKSTTLKGTGGEMRSMLAGLVYAALPLLVSPLVSLDPYVFMPVLAVIGVVAAVVLGRVLLATTARNIEAFE